jgi:prophage tail gpP-like protein
MILKISDRIRNRRVDFFNSFALDLKYDSVGSTFSFSLYYDPSNAEHRQLVCVSHFHECTLEHNDELLLTGYILSQAFSKEPSVELAAFGGYSKPGVFEDCQIPPEIYPLQSDGLTLTQIAQKLIAPFKINMIVDPSVSDRMNSVFKKTEANATQSIKSYLSELAAQKNIIISHNEKGELLFTSAKTDQKPIYHFENNTPGTKISLSFSGQQMHSHITVMKQADTDGGNAGEVTIRNPFVPTVYRPKVMTQTSGDDVSIEEAAKNALADELKNIHLTIETDRWEIDGKIIKPNSIISVVAPELYIFNKTNFFVSEVKLVGDNTKTVATLTCVLPEVFSGKAPTNIFVSDHFAQNKTIAQKFNQ